MAPEHPYASPPPCLDGRGVPALVKGAPAPAHTGDELAALVASCTPEHQAAAVLAATLTWMAGQRSADTRRGYAIDVSYWVDFLARLRIGPLEARTEDAGDYLQALRRAGYSVATQRRRLAAASSWHSALNADRPPTHHPFVDLDRPAAPPQSAAGGPTGADLDRLLDYADEHEGPRTCAILTLAVEASMSVADIIAARLDGLDVDQGDGLDVGQEDGQEDGQGDGGGAWTLTVGVRRYDLSARASRALSAWLAVRGGTLGPLFQTRTGAEMRQQYISGSIRRILAAAGVAPVSVRSVQHGGRVDR